MMLSGNQAHVTVSERQSAGFIKATSLCEWTSMGLHWVMLVLRARASLHRTRGEKSRGHGGGEEVGTSMPVSWPLQVPTAHSQIL